MEGTTPKQAERTDHSWRLQHIKPLTEYTQIHWEKPTRIYSALIAAVLMIGFSRITFGEKVSHMV